MEAILYAHEKITQIQLNDDYIRNNSVEYDFPFELNNFDEQKSGRRVL